MESKKIDAPERNIPSGGGKRMVAFIIPLITVLVLGVVVGLNFDNIVELVTGEDDTMIDTQDDYYIGKELTVTGLLDKSNDYRKHTHTLVTQDHDTFGLRSSSLNLALYEGRATVRGTVEEYFNGMYILQVETAEEAVGVGTIVTGDVIDTPDTGSIGLDVVNVALDPSELYFPDAGLLFDVTGERTYKAAKTDDSTIVLTPINERDESVNINFFACNTANPNTDCAGLQEQFSSTAEFTITSANGDVYYKLPEAPSWFVTNPGLYGYFVNGASTETIESLTRYIVLPNRKYVSDNVMPYATQLCSTVDHALTIVDKFETQSDGDTLITMVWGSDKDNNALICELSIDLQNNLGAELVSLEVDGNAIDIDAQDDIEDEQANTQEEEEQEETMDQADNDTMGNNSQAVDYDVEQFPISEDSPYIFSSSRGHTIIFPSKNISFAPGEGDSSLSLEGADCYSHTNIVAYTNEDSVQTNPSVKIYECTVVDDITSYGEYRYVESEDGKEFLIEVLDGAWKKFADNIDIN